MKTQLKYSLLSLFILICALLIWFFFIDVNSQTIVNKFADQNLNKQNALSSQIIPKIQEKKLIKGLFVDYYIDELDDFNKTNMTTHLNTLNDGNFTFTFDVSKIGLLTKPHKDLIDPMRSRYFQFFLFEDMDKNATQSTKAKLCIIIDDMASREQVSELKATGLKLTPSFFPADKNHPKTPILAREFEFFMVHLPLAAVHYSYEERETLDPNDSQELINAKIAQIVKDFQGVKFINNHTGSLFTDDTKAMRKLFHALKRHDLIFVDSVTISSSKGTLMSREFGQIPIKRDIFLDNENDVDIIKVKIQEAVQIARKKGFAIAIAHPKKNTFKALKQSKELLKSVELVYLSEVYENP